MRKMRLVLQYCYYGQDFLLEAILDKDSPLKRDEQVFLYCPHSRRPCSSECVFFDIGDLINGKVETNELR